MTLVVKGSISSTNKWAEDTRATTSYSVRVKVEDRSKSENLQNNIVLTSASYFFIIRNIADVTTNDHFEWDGVNYNIIGIEYKARRRYLKCSVKRQNQ